MDSLIHSADIFGNLTFLVENDLGSGKNVGFGKDDGTKIDRSKLDFFGVSSPIVLCFIERRSFRDFTAIIFFFQKFHKIFNFSNVNKVRARDFSI